MTKSKKMGRPTKKEALTRAIAALGELGIDYQLVDPRNILAAIAADPAASESGRIRACLALMGGSIVDYTARKKQEVCDREQWAAAEDLRRRFEEADEVGRARVVDEAKASYFSLLGEMA